MAKFQKDDKVSFSLDDDATSQTGEIIGVSESEEARQYPDETWYLVTGPYVGLDYDLPEDKLTLARNHEKEAGHYGYGKQPS